MYISVIESQLIPAENSANQQLYNFYREKMMSIPTIIAMVVVAILLLILCCMVKTRRERERLEKEALREYSRAMKSIGDDHDFQRHLSNMYQGLKLGNLKPENIGLDAKKIWIMERSHYEACAKKCLGNLRDATDFGDTRLACDCHNVSFYAEKGFFTLEELGTSEAELKAFRGKIAKVEALEKFREGFKILDEAGTTLTIPMKTRVIKDPSGKPTAMELIGFLLEEIGFKPPES